MTSTPTGATQLALAAASWAGPGARFLAYIHFEQSSCKGGWELRGELSTLNLVNWSTYEAYDYMIN